MKDVEYATCMSFLFAWYFKPVAMVYCPTKYSHQMPDHFTCICNILVILILFYFGLRKLIRQIIADVNISMVNMEQNKDLYVEYNRQMCPPLENQIRSICRLNTNPLEIIISVNYIHS